MRPFDEQNLLQHVVGHIDDLEQPGIGQFQQEHRLVLLGLGVDAQLELDLEQLALQALGLEVYAEIDLRPDVTEAGAPGFSNDRSLTYCAMIWIRGAPPAPLSPPGRAPVALIMRSFAEGFVGAAGTTDRASVTRQRIGQRGGFRAAASPYA
ncbi:MAG: hypothetical protein WDM81_15840 [Rhizomicrobium sp.]